jgi:hypothetical protein
MTADVLPFTGKSKAVPAQYENVSDEARRGMWKRSRPSELADVLERCGVPVIYCDPAAEAVSEFVRAGTLPKRTVDLAGE